MTLTSRTRATQRLTSFIALILLIGHSSAAQNPPHPNLDDVPKNRGAATSRLKAVVRERLRPTENGLRALEAFQESTLVIRIEVEDEPTAVVQWLEQNQGVVLGVKARHVGAKLPARNVADLEQLPGVVRVDLDEPADSQALSQGTSTHNSLNWNANGFAGLGVKVGIIDSFSGVDAYIGTELPPSTRVFTRCYYSDGGFAGTGTSLCSLLSGSDHGVTVAETLTDVAPGVTLYLSNASTGPDEHDALDWMLANGVKVINYSKSAAWESGGNGTSSDPFSTLQLAARAAANGALFVAAAGNYGERSWFGPWRDNDADGFLDHSSGDVFVLGFVLAGDQVKVQVRWQDAWPGATRDLDLYVVDPYFNTAATSDDFQSGGPGHRPIEMVSFTAPYSGTYYVNIRRHAGSFPAWIQVLTSGDAPSLEPNSGGAYALRSPAESSSAGVLAVGATRWDTNTVIESYSSQGPTPDGRIKPDIVGVDNTTAASGSTSGTSFAAPHVAGLAALLAQGYPNETPAGAANHLRDWAQARGVGRPNSTWGAGLAYLPGLATVTANVAGTGAGSVTAPAILLNCGAGQLACRVTPFLNTSATLTATPAAGSAFAGWSGGMCGDVSPTCSLTVTGNAAVTATFNLVPCSYTVTPTSHAVTSATQQVSFDVTTSRADCAWTTTSQSPWIAILAGEGRSGSGAVVVSVSANSGAQRLGSITVAGQTLSVVQNAPEASFTLNASSWAPSHEGGSTAVTLTSSVPSAAWTTTSDAAWLSATPAVGTGTATLGVTATPNASATPRSATLTIGGQVLNVTQAGQAAFTLSTNSSRWFLAEGANNATFAEEILIGNPSAQALKITVTLLPQADAVAPTLARTFDLAASSRLTLRLSGDFNLNGSASARVTAVLASDGTTPADIVVERTMYFQGPSQPGSHNASAVTQSGLSDRWTLAEGSGGVFETFVLVANPNPTPTTIRATYLTSAGQSFVTVQVAPANSRVTLYPRSEHAVLGSSDFSTVIESLTAGNLVIAERAMYFDNFRSGHDALGVTGPSTTWLFAEGFTGGNAHTAFETYLLLANTGNTDTVATVDYLLDNGQVVSRNYVLPARQRFTVWVDQEGRTFDNRLATAAFGIRVTSVAPIVAERAMYWGTPSAADPATPTFPWREGHATAGAVSGEAKWAFAEGQQGAFGSGAIGFDTFFLLANPQNIPVLVQATFVREDGKGIVRTVCVAPNSRNNIWTASYPELSGRRFATFLESINGNDPACPAVANTGFVAERAVYSGAGFLAGHVNGGTRWTGTIATPPPVAPASGVASVSPSSGRIGGGQTITITGAGFQQGAKVYFDNSTWTSDRNANTKLADVDQATDVVVSQDGTTITAKTPTRDFYNGYQTAGPTTVRVVNPDASTTSLANGFTFKLKVLAFGDDYVYGTVSGGGRAGTPFPAKLEALLKAFQKDLLNPTTGVATGTKVLQFGEYVTVTNAGSVGECASATAFGCTAQSGQSRFPALADTTASSADAFDVVILAEGVNDVEANVLPTSAAGALRNMVASARDRKIVIIMTKYEETDIGSLSPGSVKALGDAIWSVTTDTSLGVEIYRQTWFRIPTAGGSPTQAGYDQMASDIYTKLTREFPLQPCDARNDKPGKGCPRNP